MKIFYSYLLQLIIFFFFLSTTQDWSEALAQRQGNRQNINIGHFYGKIVDSTTNKGIEFASVQLIGSVFDTVTKTMKKDVVVAGQLTLENGDFSIEKINIMGKYNLNIFAMGYTKIEILVSFNIDMEKIKSGGGMSMMEGADKDLGNIKMKQNINFLKSVEITSASPVLELKLDKKVFHVNNSLSSEGGTAEDVLKKVPSVSVDMDGNVTMRNAPPQIFVDGKPSTLMLDQIPSDAIESIELITNPSAKYDASGGQGGILNIVLKKNRRIGYNGSIRAGADHRGKINGGGDINAREGKLNAFASAHLRQRYSITNGNTYRENIIGSPLTTITQDNYSITNGMFMHSRGGIDWFMNNRNTLTFSGNYFQGKFTPTDKLTTLTDTVWGGSSSYKRNSETERQFHNTGVSIQYKHLFPKEETEMTGDINFNRVEYTSRGDYISQYYDADGNTTGTPLSQKMTGSGSNQIISGQTDYKYTIDSASKIETGLKGSSREFVSKIENFLMNEKTGEFEIIQNQSSNYSFIDQIFGAYALYIKQIKKMNYQAGVRAESSFYTGELVDSNKTFKNYYPASLFPSFSATYQLNKNDNFQLSYSRRINRPSFFQIIPYTDYSDSLNLNKGNAGLKPEFTHSLELSHLKSIGKKHSMLTSIYFKNSTDLITSFLANEYDSVLQKNTLISTYENADASYIYGGELTGKFVIIKWMDLTLNFNGYYSILDAKNIDNSIRNEHFSWFTKENITIKFLRNFSIELTPEYHSRVTVPLNNNEKKYGGWGNGPTATAQGYVKERFEMDAGIRYQFLKNKAAIITLNVQDVFGTNENVTVNNSDYFNQTSKRLRDPQFFRINFSYRFGKFDSSLFKRKNTNVNTDGSGIGM